MSAAEEIHEGEIVPDTGMELVATTIPRELSRIVSGETPGEIMDKAGQIANVLKDLIHTQGLAANVGGGKKHVEVGGWQAAGTMLGALGGQPLHAETVWTRRVLDETGKPERTTYTQHIKRYYPKNQGGGLREESTAQVDGFSWEAKVQVCTPDGTVLGSAEAMCGRSESTWASREDFALRSMAETRAESRAYRRAIGWIINMAGYSATPAEEMGHDATAGPANGPAAEEVLASAARDGLAILLPAPAVAQTCMANIIAACGGYLPASVAGALAEVAQAYPFVDRTPPRDPNSWMQDHMDRIEDQ